LSDEAEGEPGEQAEDGELHGPIVAWRFGVWV
jgi:hypothetical protein